VKLLLFPQPNVAMGEYVCLLLNEMPACRLLFYNNIETEGGRRGEDFFCSALR